MSKDTLGAGDSFIAAFTVSLLQDGWARNVHLSRKNIENALMKASNFASDICKLDGAFGYCSPIVDV
jgi:sugar/nucleoside kinase (ribokinase family)